MKKILAILLVALMVLTGCSKKDNGGKGEETPKGIKIGTGAVVTEKFDAEKAKYESNTTYATVVFEGDVIKYVYIDTAQNSFVVDGEAAKDFQGLGTKKERGKDYGMVANGGSKLEWFEQIAKVEEFMTGKTIKDVEAKKGDADLTSSVSINVDGYIAAVKDAAANAVEVKDAAKIAVGSKTSLGGFKINTNFTAIATDADGKIVYAYLDAAQTSPNKENNAVGGIVKTKKQLGPDYGMKKNPKAIAEWDEQAKAFEEFMVGKSVADVLAMKTKPGADENHPAVPDEADLVSKVTIDVTGFLELITHVKDSFKDVK